MTATHENLVKLQERVDQAVDALQYILGEAITDRGYDPVDLLTVELTGGMGEGDADFDEMHPLVDAAVCRTLGLKLLRAADRLDDDPTTEAAELDLLDVESKYKGDL